MGLNPTILRQVRAFALAVTPSEPPAVHRRGYRASGLVLTSFPAVRLLATNVSFGRIEPTGDRKPADGPPAGAVRGLLVLDYSVRYGPIAVERYRPNVVHLRNGDRGDLKR
jgi:hypothetical protein